MGDNPKKAYRLINSATKWLASECNYFEDLEGDLNKLQKAITGHTKKRWFFVKELKEALDDFYRAARSEKRLNRYLERIDGLKLGEMYEFEAEQAAELFPGTAAGIRQQMAEAHQVMNSVERRMNVEGRHLVKAASFYEGQIKAKLDALKNDVDDYVKLMNGRWSEQLKLNPILPKSEGDLSEKESAQFKVREDKIKGDLNELKEMVDNAQEWVAALASDLNRAKEVSRKFMIEQVVTPQKLQQQISHFGSPERRLQYLEIFLKPKAREAFTVSVFEEARRQIGIIAKKSNLWQVAAEICERNGLEDTAKRYWKNEGDLCLSLHKYKEAAEAYQKAKEWDKAGDAWLQSFEPLHHLGTGDYDESVTKAAEAYTKAGDDGYKTVAVKLMRMGKAKVGGDIYKPTIFGHAGLMFYKTGDFENAGEAWVAAACSTVYDAVASYYYGEAAKAYGKAGNVQMEGSCRLRERLYATYAWAERERRRAA